jgi:beta-lactamase regulating signal transducer with metallopeptidase domain
MSSFANGWVTAMWTACWQGGLLILAVWLVCRLAPRMNPSLRQALWWLACLKLVVGIVWARPVSLPLLPERVTPIHARLADLAPAVTAPAPQPSQPAAPPGLPWTEGLFGLWLLGFAVTTGLAVLSGWRMRRVVRTAASADDGSSGEELRRLSVQMGLSAPPRLLSSAEVTAPLVVGHWRPAILVPREFEDRLTLDERRMALAHELAHVRRRDLWLAIVPAVAYALFYFFPPVWIACREWAADREATCDTEAIAATGAVPKAYGQLLMKIVAGDHRRVIAGLGATANFNTLKRRIVRMKVEGDAGRPWPGRIALGAGSLFLVPWSLTAAVPTGSLIANPGMEDGRFQPSGWLKQGQLDTVRQIWDRSVSRSGSSSLCITRSDDRFWPITEWVHPINYDGKSRYVEFGAWIKADHARKAVLDVQFYDGKAEWSHHWAAYIGEKETGDAPATHDWRWYSGVVEIPSGTAELKVALQDYGGGTVWMDDVVVRFVDRPVTDDGGKR